jgi:hypothetical protein
LGGAAAVVAAITACVDLSAPKDAPASISLLQTGSLFVVQGDVLRDTLGNPSKLGVIAYDGAGNEVGGFSPSFFVTDSLPNVVLNADGTITGKAIGTASLIGQIGNLQTPPLKLFVTVAPTSLVRVGTAVSDTVRAPVGSDSASAIGSVAAQAGVRGAANAIIGGAFVRFEITYAPESRPGTIGVYLEDDNKRAFPKGTSTPDTTDLSGNASRKVVVNSRGLADADLVAGRRTDSVVVQVTAKYRGLPLAGSPLRLVIPVKVSFGL